MSHPAKECCKKDFCKSAKNDNKQGKGHCGPQKPAHQHPAKPAAKPDAQKPGCGGACACGPK